MRQCPRLNSENKQLMDEILRQAVAIFPATESCLPFIGAILYLNKMGAELVDKKSGSMLVNRASELDDLLSHDPLHDVVLSVFENINVCAKDEEELRFLLLSVDMAAFHNGEQLYWYDYAIGNASRYKRHDNLSMMPNELATLVLAFVGADAKKVLVPFGGTMNCVMEFDSFESIDSFELNHQTWQIGMFRMALTGMASKVHFSNMNVDYWPTNRYDTVISMPPMGMRIKMSTQPAFFESHSMEYTDIIAPCRFLESTNEDGVCVAFAPVSLLNDESVKKRFRKWAMAEKIIDTVILLPGNLLYDTVIPLSCVILRRKSCHGEAIRMIDATEMYNVHQNRRLLSVGDVMSAYHSDVENVSCTVSYERIRENDYSWNVKEYFKEDVVCPDGFTISPLEDLTVLPQMVTSICRDKGFVVKISDLSNDWTHPYISTETLAKEAIARAYLRLERDAILVSTVRTLRPSIIKASAENPVWINPNILAIVPNETIDAEYLCMKLSEMEIQTVGGTPHISKSYLLRQKIVYPNLSMQKSLFAEGVRAHKLAKAKDLGLQDLIDQMKTDYINEVRVRKHDMKTPMAQLRNTFTLIKELIVELPEASAQKLGKYIGRQEKAMDVLSNIVAHIADEEVFATPEVIDIESELKSFEEVTDRYFIEYHRDEASLQEAGIGTPYLKIGKVDFTRLVQNIVSNAVKRGFVKGAADYALHITLSVENEFYVIDFSNNGEPLPEGMDKVRYGTKGAKGTDSDGSGTGGYVVKRITQHYGGDFDIRSYKLANMDFTNVIVKLPIYRKGDE